MKPMIPMAALCLAAVLLSTGPAWSGDGHDHGEAPPTAAGPALPRFAAVSETFELVGVLNGRQITLYLDRSADNSPVPNAQIELEIAGTAFKAVPHGDAEYEIALAEAPQAGVLPITATVTAGQEVDLLAGELDLHESSASQESSHSPAWKAYAGWVVGAVVVVAALAAIAAWSRRGARSRQTREGGAA